MRVTRGNQAIGDEEAGTPMIGVQAITPPRVVAEYNFGPDFPDPVGHLPALANPGLEFAVGPTEKGHIALTPECPRRRSLLFPAQRDQRDQVGIPIPRSPGAVGAHQVMKAAPGGSPFCECGATAKLDVIGMGTD